MLDSIGLSHGVGNRLLAKLPAENYRQLLGKLEEYPLNYREYLHQEGGRIDYVYFPTSGIISLLVAVDGKSTLEVGIVGSEGVVGISLFLGRTVSNNRTVVQGQGFALRMKAAAFVSECETNKAFSLQLRRFTYSLLIQVSQSAACYRFHPVEARLARWLLMTSDRMASNAFQITQEFLSNMLGVRREAVNKSATILQSRNLIGYTRGNMTILDRPGLERDSCECYAILKDEGDPSPA